MAGREHLTGGLIEALGARLTNAQCRLIARGGRNLVFSVADSDHVRVKRIVASELMRLCLSDQVKESDQTHLAEAC
jgi:hypothetical protein